MTAAIVPRTVGCYRLGLTAVVLNEFRILGIRHPDRLGDKSGIAHALAVRGHT